MGRELMIYKMQGDLFKNLYKNKLGFSFKKIEFKDSVAFIITKYFAKVYVSLKSKEK